VKRIRRRVITDCFARYSAHGIALAHFLIYDIYGFSKGRRNQQNIKGLLNHAMQTEYKL
jgi:hypothetical protein